MLKQIRTIACYTLLEALRNRLIWLIAVVACAAIGLSGFLNELALTEKREVQLAIMAAILRLATVFLLATFVVSSMVREFNDKGLELLLALPMRRASYLLGKMAGFTALATVMAALFGLLTALQSSPLQSLIWTLSLIFECWIVTALSMLCVLTYTQVAPAFCAVAGFYFVARSISALALISQQPLIENSTSQSIIHWMIEGMSAVLPHLDAFARTDWLIYGGANWQVAAMLLTQTVIYLLLLSGAALFDLYRKNI